MACSAVDDVGVSYVFPVVCNNELATWNAQCKAIVALTNEDSPEVDEGEEGNICELL